MSRLNITEMDLRSPYRFSEKVPGILTRARLRAEHARQPWEWRQHALRSGRRPVGLFVWCMQHPEKAAAIMSWEDEREAGIAMASVKQARIVQDLPAAPPKGIDPGFYQRHLRSGLWRWIRKLKLRDAKYTCGDCGARKVRFDLHVHHKTYVRLGRERLEDLEVLCYACHDQRHHGRTGLARVVDGIFEAFDSNNP